MLLAKLKPQFTLNNGVLLVALLVTVSWVWGTVGAIQQNFLLQQQVDGLGQKIAYQELENQTLIFENQYFQSKEYLEVSARDNLSLANPGEKLLILPPETAHDSAPAPVTQTPIAKRSNFQQWLYFLFGDKS